MNSLENILLYHGEKNLSPSPDFWTPFLLGLIGGYFIYTASGRALVKKGVSKAEKAYRKKIKAAKTLTPIASKLV